MAKSRLPAPEVLRQLLRYEAETGKLFWRPRPASMFAAEWQQRGWNTKYAGNEAFTADCGEGYKTGTLFDVKVRAHIVAWALHHGVWPNHQVDHRNLNRADNRIANLRRASNGQNMMNGSLRSNNTSGHKGVSWSKHTKKWLVMVTARGKTHYCGLYERKDDAIAARTEMAAKLHGEFARD